MNAYLDSSVVVRKLLEQPDAIPSWGAWDGACSSALLEVEAIRTLLRLHHQGALADDELGESMGRLRDLLVMVDLIPVSGPVLQRACQPLPIPLKTLDALHLASALLWEEKERLPLAFLSHDVELMSCASAMGLRASLAG